MRSFLLFRPLGERTLGLALLRVAEAGLRQIQSFIAPPSAAARAKSAQNEPRNGAVTQGTIALVGAGPGACDLLTIRALQRLQEADVIFYDRLVDPQMLALARPEAEKIYVGKAVGAHDWPQQRIDAVIVAAALRGQRVVRLKSGAPGLFGRATEELAAARTHNIAVEIVPGVTAASAAGAALGRALSERGATDRVVFATGTCRPGAPNPDWGASMVPGTTLALYMGVKQAPIIEANLLQAGVPGTAEVEIVSEISTPRQRIATSVLADLSATIRRENIANPAIILIRHTKGHVSERARLPAVAEPQHAAR
ncbi:uroporphyrinogen-III C-methyltransferase [Rhodobacter lacus]|uniref:uroporphyrinogen-III C-methyltransferase n=1 Tax=Rhodobacter lacus TaxID=1641972 RepID=A0ABW5AD96_9RHOB